MLKKVTLKDLDLIDSIEKTCFPSQEAASKDSLKGRLEVYPEGFYLYYVDETPIGYIGGLKNNQCELPDEMYENASLHHPNGDYQLIFSVCILPDYRHKGYARKDHLIPFYESCGFRFKGVSKSVHGNAKWNDMVRINERER